MFDHARQLRNPNPGASRAARFAPVTTGMQLRRGLVRQVRSLLVAVLLIAVVLPASARAQTAGDVWGWGAGTAGQLGNGVLFANQLTPVAGPTGMVGLTGGGGMHTLGIKADGTLWSWGLNDYGQLGDGTTTWRATAGQVPGLTGVTAVAAGLSHTLALKNDGTVWAWGKNEFGQLGDSTNVQRLTAVQVSGLTGIRAIGAGANHSLAIRSDGALLAWGWNGANNLGDGTQTDRWTPVAVLGISDVRAASGGAHFSLALRNDGTVWAWGKYGSGQLGVGPSPFGDAREPTPKQVLGIAPVQAIAAGGFFSLALHTDGTVSAWGHNLNGSLGDGTTTERYTPVPVPGLTGVTAIAAGNLHSLARRSDGTVLGWGWNSNGQVGDGTTTNRTSPVVVANLPVAAIVAAGYWHSLILRTAIDSTPPSINASAAPPAVNGWNNSPVTVSLAAQDNAGGSGVKEISYTVDEGVPVVIGGASGSLTLSGNGAHTVAYYAKDNAGNTSPPNTLTVNIDTMPPTTDGVVSQQPANGWYRSDVTIGVTAVDYPGGSGVKEIVYTVDGGLPVVVAGASTSVTIAADGAHVLSHYARDHAGNQSLARQLTVNLDKTAPTCTVTVNPSQLGPANHKLVDVNAAVNVNDALSGAAGFRLVSVTSNEPDNGQGDGDETSDIQGWAVGTPDTAGQLRAERSGTGAGRVYTLTYQVLDTAGNVATCAATATAPR